MKMMLATAVMIASLLLASPVYAQNRYYLPQIANGDYGGVSGVVQGGSFGGGNAVSALNAGGQWSALG
jgi:hypothetical protein